LNPGNAGPDNNGTGTYSVTLSVPIFDRLQSHQSVSIARLQLRQGETQARQAGENVRAEFEQDRQKYVSGLQRADLETRNLEVAKQQADAAFEQYKVGKITTLALRDAQRLLLDSRSRLITAYQNTKQAELALKRLAGLLVHLSPPTPIPPGGRGEEEK
jgi:outer membrane protein TolC